MTKRPYEGTTLVRFGDAVDVTLGCNCGDCCDCDCGFYRSGGDTPIQVQ